MPTVISLQLHQAENQALIPVAQAQALLDLGLEGDSHSQRGPGRKRQVLILDASTADHFGLRPGDLREQITIRGLPEISILPPGRRLSIGEVSFEAVGDCTPCLHIGELLGVEDPEAFRQALDKRRGLLCRVVEVNGGGLIRLGDSVELI
jgi:MOSC domain-containing protein YiiM